MDFDEKFIDMVWPILSNNWYSLNINGQVEDFFHSSRGVKQRDPLSPCLFIIGAEVLSTGLIDLFQNKQTLAFSMPLHCPLISHLAFADDMIIFTNGAKQFLQHLMNFLSLYKIGQSISKAKSCILLETLLLILGAS